MTPRVEQTAAKRRGARGATANVAEAAAPAIEADEVSPAGPRRGARKTMVHYMRQLPLYLRLLAGLLTDRRVAGTDKLLVAGAVAYILMPIDLVPDFIPFLGEVDDVYFLVIALQRLIANAGRTVLLSHWSGAPGDLADMNLRAVFTAASFFLPGRLRRRLRGMVR